MAGVETRWTAVHRQCFTALPTFNVPPGNRQEATLERPVTAQRLKFVVTANCGDRPGAPHILLSY